MAYCVNKANLGFKNQTEKEIVNTYHKFYSFDDEHKYGVVVFKIKKI